MNAFEHRKPLNYLYDHPNFQPMTKYGYAIINPDQIALEALLSKMSKKMELPKDKDTEDDTFLSLSLKELSKDIMKSSEGGKFININYSYNPDGTISNINISMEEKNNGRS